MRLDRFFTETATCSRSQASAMIRRGEVSVDGVVICNPATQIDPEKQQISLSGRTIPYRRNLYIMLNKPKGYVCATEDAGPTVLDLLPENLRRAGLFPCGRLDKNTEGFLLITDNGALAHRLLSPKFHVEKTYRFRVKFPLSDADVATLERGVELDGRLTAPCKVVRAGEREGQITLSEGKFHQIKRMMEAVHNQITDLRRISFAGIHLDATLEPGGWRMLTSTEEAILESAGNSNKLEPNFSKNL